MSSSSATGSLSIRTCRTRCSRRKDCLLNILSDVAPINYRLPQEYRECVRMFLGPARGRGLFTGSLENIVAAIPKHNGYHFRGDSAYTSILASVIAHRFRLVNAKVKVVPEDFLQQLIDEFPFDERKQREFLMCLRRCSFGSPNFPPP